MHNFAETRERLWEDLLAWLRTIAEEDTMTIERFPVEAGHIMLFARAIGDDNPVYYGA